MDPLMIEEKNNCDVAAGSQEKWRLQTTDLSLVGLPCHKSLSNGAGYHWPRKRVQNAVTAEVAKVVGQRRVSGRQR